MMMRNNNFSGTQKPISPKQSMRGFIIFSLVFLIAAAFMNKDRIFAIIVVLIDCILLGVVCIPPIFKKNDEDEVLFSKRLGIMSLANTATFMLLGSNEVGNTIGEKVVALIISICIAVLIIGTLEFFTRKASKRNVEPQPEKQPNSKKPMIAAMISCGVSICLLQIFPDFVRSYIPVIVPYALAFIFLLFYPAFIKYRTLKKHKSHSDSLANSEFSEKH